MVQVFVTGGTFDKEYNFITGELYLKTATSKRCSTGARCTIDIDIKTLMMIDSLEMTPEDREIILHNCRKTPHRHILITHGTDRIVATAKELAQHNLSDKTIVLTGAMVPYAFGTSSDGFFNLGSALAFAQTLPSGVYIVMNGRYFDWDNVRKNRRTGNFEEVKEERE